MESTVASVRSETSNVGNYDDDDDDVMVLEQKPKKRKPKKKRGSKPKFTDDDLRLLESSVTLLTDTKSTLSIDKLGSVAVSTEQLNKALKRENFGDAVNIICQFYNITDQSTLTRAQVDSLHRFISYNHFDTAWVCDIDVFWSNLQCNLKTGRKKKWRVRKT